MFDIRKCILIGILYCYLYCIIVMKISCTLKINILKLLNGSWSKLSITRFTWNIYKHKTL